MPASPTVSRPSITTPGWLVVALTGLGLAARLPRLIAESLWYDEIAAWVDYGVRGPVAIVTTYYDPANHIAHTLLTWISVTMLGGLLDATTALRFPAFVFSLASIPVGYGLGRQAAGRVAGLVTAAVLAIAPVAVLEGVDARGYSMMIFFAAASTWAALRALASRKGTAWTLYAGLIALGIWSHLTTVFLAVGHGLFFLLRFVRGARDLRPCLGLAFAAALTLALYAPVLDDLFRLRATFDAAQGDEPSPVGIEGWHALLQIGGAWRWWVALPGLALAVAGLTRLRRAPPEAGIGVALSLAGLPIMVVILVLAGSWMYARFALFALPGAALLMALGFDAMCRRQPLLAAILAIVISSGWAVDLALRPAKQPLAEAAHLALEHCTPETSILVFTVRHRVMDLYLPRSSVEYAFDLGRDLDSTLRDADISVAVILYPDLVQADRTRRLQDAGLERRADLAGWADWGRGRVEIWWR